MKIKKNGKVIKLTESDLQKIVKRVLNEQSEDPSEDQSEDQLEVLICLANAADLTYEDVAKCPSCIVAGTDIVNNKTPEPQIISKCIMEVKDVIGEKCGSDYECILQSMGKFAIEAPKCFGI